MDTQGSPIIITYRYKDAKEAIDWLCRAFGFTEKVVHVGEAGSIDNAQLVLNNAMIMIASERDNEFDRFVKHPQDIEGYNTISPYIIIKNIEQHYQNAVQQGAEICLPLTVQDYGGSGYTCKDIEGYLWNFGSYDPWKE